jgi:hypothetical protein
MGELFPNGRDPDVESVMVATRPLVEAAARDLELDRRVVDIQVRLHLPMYPRIALQQSSAMVQVVAKLLEALRSRLETTAYAVSRAREASGLAAVKADSVVSHRQIVGPDESVVGPVEVRPVPPEVGFVYQEQLHYLHCRRSDTIEHWGLYVGGAAVPIAYVAFSRCDRQYVVNGLVGAGLEARMATVAVLTRAYALPPSPRNAMSHLMAGAIARCGLTMPHDFLVTALNPMLGFDGATFRSIGFRPFATVPKAYSYDSNGLYCTRRTGQFKIQQQLDTPPNFLLARIVDRTASQMLPSKVHIVPLAEYEALDVVVEGSQSA